MKRMINPPKGFQVLANSNNTIVKDREKEAARIRSEGKELCVNCLKTGVVIEGTIVVGGKYYDECCYHLLVSEGKL